MRPSTSVEASWAGEREPAVLRVEDGMVGDLYGLLIQEPTARIYSWVSSIVVRQAWGATYKAATYTASYSGTRSCACPLAIQYCLINLWLGNEDGTDRYRSGQ
jgi:hypothetical protein